MEVDLLVFFADVHNQDHSGALGLFAFSGRNLVFSAALGRFFVAPEEYEGDLTKQDI